MAGLNSHAVIAYMDMDADVRWGVGQMRTNADKGVGVKFGQFFADVLCARRGVIWGGWGLGAVAPPRKKKKRKKRKKRKKKKKKERKKGTMNNVNLLYIKCCYFPIFQ